MEINNIDISRAINFQFEDLAWKKKILILGGINFVITAIIILGAISIAFAFGSSITRYLTIDYSKINVSSGLLSLLFLAFGVVVSYIFNIYLSGFGLEITKNKMVEDVKALPELSLSMGRFGSGFKYLFLLFIFSLLFSLIAGFVSGIGSNFTGPVTILFNLFERLISAVEVTWNIFVTPFLVYNLVTIGFFAAISFKNFQQIINVSWKDFAIFGLISFVGGLGVCIFCLIPIVGWLAAPFLVIMASNAYYHALGQLFFNLKAKLGTVNL